MGYGTIRFTLRKNLKSLFKVEVLKSAPDRTRTCYPQIRKPKAGFVTPTNKRLTEILKANDYSLTTTTTYGNHELYEANLKLKIDPMREGSLNGN